MFSIVKEAVQNNTPFLTWQLLSPNTLYSPLLCPALAAPVKVIVRCLFFILALINPYRWMKSFWERRADLSQRRHYWLHAACTLSQCFLIHTRPTSLNKLLVGMWTCMPRLTGAKRRHLSESLRGDADVSYYHCHWNFAPFQSIPLGFYCSTIYPLSTLNMWNSPVGVRSYRFPSRYIAILSI